MLLAATSGPVAGYCTLSARSVELASLPNDIARKLPRYPIPATLIGRLAVDTSYHGQRLGGMVLFDALERAHLQRTQIGAMAVIVDAKHEQARAISTRYAFRGFVADEFRLFLSMSTIGQLVKNV